MFRKLIGGLTSTAVIGGLVTAGAVAASVATASPALAASVNIGTVEAQMAGHTGKSGQVSNADNCIRFDPPAPPAPAVETTWVTNPTEAATSHGSSTGSCPTDLSRFVQSAVGITPVAGPTTVNTGTSFLLGTMRHYNNPINVAESSNNPPRPAKFVGNLNVKLQSTTFTFPYELYETPNSCSGKVDDEQVNCSDDILEFTSTPTGELTITNGGVDYAFSLVSSGFGASIVDPQDPTKRICPATPEPPTKTKFITTEGTTTTACLYGKLAQKRSIKLVKKVEWNPDVNGPTSIPDFKFTSTSDLVGSPWKTEPGNLQPANTNGATASYGPKDFRAGVETVTITEGADPANWTFKDVQCVDGTDAAVTGVSYDGRTVTLANVPDATSSDAVPITCTFTNSYTPALRPGINVVKAADPAGPVRSGTPVKYTYTVTNTGNTSLSSVTVTDNKCSPVTYKSGDTNSDNKLQTTETWIYECTTTLANTTTNIATATGTPPVGPPVTDTDTVTVTVIKPGIKVVKAADKTQVRVGDSVKYTYTVTNTGDSTLSSVSVTDDKCSPVTYKSGDTNSDNKLQTTETWIYECTTTLSETTTNIAEVTGTPPVGPPVKDDDTVTVTVIKPGIKVVKAADKTQVRVGDSVKYTYTVTNTGDSTLSSVSVTDDKCSPVTYKSGDTNSDNKLQTTETWIYECTTTLANTTTNIAEVTGTPPVGPPVKDDDTVTVTVIKPGIKVVKAADKTQVRVGDSVKYTYTVTNTGDSTLSSVSVKDDKCSPVTYKSGDTNSDNKLQTTETWIYECTTTLSETTTNIAEVTGTPPVGPPVKDDDTVTVTVIKPGIKVVKAADKTQVRVGDSVKYTYTVTNTGDSTLSSVSVTDDKCSPVTYKSGDTNSDNKLQTTETWIYECTTTLSETTTNIAEVTGTPPVGPPVKDDDTVTVTVIKPGIKVVKAADKTQVRVGDSVKYTYTVTNTGDSTLSSVSVTDDKCSPVTYKSGDTNSDNKLQTTETWIYECTTTLSETTTNIAEVTGTPPVGPPVKDDDTVTVTVIKPGIKVVKAADKTQVRVGDSVKYTYTVTNTGDSTLSSVSVKDDKCSPVTYKSGDTNSDNKLQTTETWIYECTTTLSETTTNIAEVTGTPPVGPPVKDDDTVTVTVIKPGIKVVKAADKTQVRVGDSVKYTYTVTNTGDSTLSSVSVKDDKCSPVTYKSGDTNSDNKLQTTETWLYECTTTLSETTTNIAEVTGTPPVGPPVKDDDTVTVTVIKPGIKVVKKADATEVHSGDLVTYTYTVTNTGDTPLEKVSVTDDKCSPVGFLSGDTNSDNKLQTTETWLYECTTTLTNTTTNIAEVTGTPPVGPPVKDDDTVTVTVLKPGIKVVKAADKTQVRSGDLVTYTYTVTNTGDTPLEKVSVTDDKCSPVTYKSGDTNSDNKLQTTETWLYECSTALTNTTTNIVTATGEDKLGKKVTDDDTVTVTVLKAWLTLVKQVEGKADADEWTLTAEALDHPKAPMVENLGGSGTSTEVWSQVEYTLKEEGPGNYSPMDWVCLPDKAESPTTTQVEGQLNEGDKITLKTGARVTCTIVNVRDLAELKLVKQVEGKNKPNDWTLSATAGAPDTELNFSNKGGEGDFQTVYAGTQYQLKEEGPGGYSPSDWQCELAPQDVEPGQVEEIDLKGDKITLQKGQRVTCTIINTRDLGSLTITKEFNPQASGYTGTFDINYTCVDGADKVKEGTVKLAAGKSETISGLPTGTVCTVTEPTLPANPSGWTFNSPTFSPANGQVTVTTKDQTVSVTVINSVAQVSPVVVKKICPIDVTLKKPQPKKVGNKILTKKIKTKKSSCVLLKPVVLCRPLASSAAGETAFCDTKVTKKGRITVKTKGYERVRVTVIVRTKPKPGFEDRWKPNNWRKSWILR